MSEEHVQLVERAIAAFDRQDLDLLAELVTSDVEWSPAMATIVDGEGYRGRDGIAAYFAEVRETWEAFSMFTEEIRPVGEHVLVLCRIQGRGRGSGVQVDALGALVVDFRGGKISRTRGFLDRAQATRALGLHE